MTVKSGGDPNLNLADQLLAGAYTRTPTRAWQAMLNHGYELELNGGTKGGRKAGNLEATVVSVAQRKDCNHSGSKDMEMEMSSKEKAVLYLPPHSPAASEVSPHRGLHSGPRPPTLFTSRRRNQQLDAVLSSHAPLMIHARVKCNAQCTSGASPEDEVVVWGSQLAQV
ncbi:hypothetical protein E2C01_061236 [Portunus trituberculatus]|uniref:Uncharacterized protein n=1 Tax=Portunus trituberculatus TaxID=210409 RepID=A0A5B7H7K8_PORTR|nr:hypothetical protein [Portunus trituberculatus]